MHVHPWSIPGSDGQPILGDTHLPPKATPVVGVILIAHGFRGYKDYGILPGIAHAAAKHGLIAHRFNFSHSGMSNRVETFERPDLFEKDTWARQVFDLRAVALAVEHGELPDRASKDDPATDKLPQVWLGHSRGGVTALLTAARAFAPHSYPKIGPTPKPAGVVAIASPHRAIFISDEERHALRTHGFLERPSLRTRQMLRIGRDWLHEIESQPDAFDPILAAKRVKCPLLFVYGDADDTVKLEAGEQLAAASAHADLRVIAGATHVFNTSNPMKLDRHPSTQAKELMEAVSAFAARVCGGK